jgi:hypothetical protein
VSLEDRSQVAEVTGERAERLAFLFSVIPRGPLARGTYRWAPVPGHEASRGELDALVLLHMINLADQAQAKDGSPVAWLTVLDKLAELLRDSEAIEVPPFVDQLATLSGADESTAVRAYRAALSRPDDVPFRTSRLSLAAAACPVVAEPCVWLAHIARAGGDDAAAESWARAARGRLERFGTAWDKRLRFEQWLELIDSAAPGTATAPDPRALYAEVAGGPSGPHAALDPAAGRRRFRRYVESLAETGDAALGRVYPGLDSQPWFDAHQFPLARYLEANQAEIREEILALEPGSFHRESERIERSGDWDVAFFYERGRRRDELCQACPVTAYGIETHPAMRTLTGLIYASRMRAGTHIEPHRGPTNLRVRCHLGIQVPDGDCAIRVGEETRSWQEGRCLVFDDYFEHEAWNHTDEDRIVLIVDLWHPGLSATEVSLLEGLHRYAYGHAGRLSRYWAANQAAAGQATEQADAVRF